MDVFMALLTLDSLDSNIKANCPCIAVVFPSKRKYYEEMRNALVTVVGGRNPAGGNFFYWESGLKHCFNGMFTICRISLAHAH